MIGNSVRRNVGLALGLLLLLALKSDTAVIKKDYFLVTLDDKEVGHLTIVEVDKDSVKGYALVSTVKSRFVISIVVKERITEQFKHGKLLKSTHYRTVNGTTKSSNHLWAKNGVYQTIDSLSGKTSTITEPIYTTTLSVYFEEPKGAETIYSENFRKVLKVTNDVVGVYMVHLPNDKKTKFVYEEGKLILMETKGLYGTIKFIRKQ
jgi:hypothetical protein